MARAYVAALATDDEATPGTLVITPELNRAIYACEDRQDHPVDDRVRASMSAALAPLAYGKALAAAHATTELGAWHETWLPTHAARSAVTFVCRARVATVVGDGSLAFTVPHMTNRAPSSEHSIFVAVGAVNVNCGIFPFVGFGGTPVIVTIGGVRSIPNTEVVFVVASDQDEQACRVHLRRRGRHRARRDGRHQHLVIATAPAGDTPTARDRSTGRTSGGPRSCR